MWVDYTGIYQYLNYFKLAYYNLVRVDCTGILVDQTQASLNTISLSYHILVFLPSHFSSMEQMLMLILMYLPVFYKWFMLR